MLHQAQLKHDFALALARDAMIEAANEGIAIGQWRDDVLELLTAMGLPLPPDVVAWVSSGKASDKAVTDWGQAFSLGRV
jgi:hypothetical protein